MKKLLFILLASCMINVCMAAPTTITSVSTGNWRDASTWDLGRVPENGDIIVIASTHVVTVTSNNGTCNGTPDTHLYIEGTLTFTNGSKLRLGCASSITVEVGGLIDGGSGGGSSKKIYICENEQWNSGDPDVPGFFVFGKTLPIELTDFSAVVEDDIVVIQWETAAEENNDYFELLRSTNGLTYEVIGQVTGSGTTNNTMVYEFEDYNPVEGLAYYKLRQTDYDGESETFDPIAVELLIASDGSCVLTVYPNPCPGNCRAKLSDCPKGDPQVRLMMTDATGHMVSELYDTRNFDGSFDLQIDKTNNLKPGVYVISAISGDENFSQKIIRQ